MERISCYRSRRDRRGETEGEDEGVPCIKFYGPSTRLLDSSCDHVDTPSPAILCDLHYNIYIYIYIYICIYDNI